MLGIRMSGISRHASSHHAGTGMPTSSRPSSRRHCHVHHIPALSQLAMDAMDVFLELHHPVRVVTGPSAGLPSICTATGDPSVSFLSHMPPLVYTLNALSTLDTLDTLSLSALSTM